MINVFEIVVNSETIYLVSGDDVSHAVVAFLSGVRASDVTVDSISTLEICRMSEDDMAGVTMEVAGEVSTLLELVEDLETSEILAAYPLQVVEFLSEDLDS